MSLLGSRIYSHFLFPIGSSRNSSARLSRTLITWLHSIYSISFSSTPQPELSLSVRPASVPPLPWPEHAVLLTGIESCCFRSRTPGPTHRGHCLSLFWITRIIFFFEFQWSNNSAFINNLQIIHFCRCN